VELPAADDVVPLSAGNTQAADTLRRSDFFRECMAPRTASFKVPAGRLESASSAASRAQSAFGRCL